MASENVKKSNDELEIDLRAFFLKLKTKWKLCVIGLLVGAVVALGYSTFFTHPSYQSSALVYLRGNSSNSISIQDLQLGTQLTKDYEIIFKSRPVLEHVKKEIQSKSYDVETKELVDNLSVESLKNMISITNQEDTRILQITSIVGNPNLAADIANAVMEFGSDAVKEIDSQKPYVVEKAIASPVRLGTSKSKMVVMGALAGLIVTLGYLFLRFVLSDNVTSVEEVEDLLGVPVLAVVLDDAHLDYKKMSKRD